MLRDKSGWMVFAYGAVFGPLFFLVLMAVDRLLFLVPLTMADAVNGYLILLYPPSQPLDVIVPLTRNIVIAWIWSMVVFAIYYGLVFLVVWRAYHLFFQKRNVKA